MKPYFIIYFSEDGLTITPSSQEDVDKLLELAASGEETVEFVTKLPRMCWGMNGSDYPEYKYLIIKGEMMVPKPVEVIKKYVL